MTVSGARTTTGDAGLDRVLHGGLPSNAIHIVMGAPGAGKTILAEQLVFANASAKRPALYLTTLSEPFAKTVTYLQGFDFFEVERLDGAVRYEDLGPTLASAGPEKALETIEALVKAHRPGLLVVDSFKAIQDMQTSLPERRRWLYQLAGLLSAYRLTTLWLGEYGADEIVRQPEFAVADGVIEFVKAAAGTRDRRFMRVHKLRGSGFQEGSHAVTISRAGLRVWPRLLTPAAPPEYEPARERIRTGVPGLDDLVDTGFWRGSATMIAGPSGSGKTALALHFALEGARLGEPSLFVHFQENPTQIGQLIRSFGRHPEADVAEGRLAFIYQSPVEMEIDTVIHKVLAKLTAMGGKRLVLDALGDLAGACEDPRRFHDYLYAIVQHCAVSNVACVLTLETANLLATERLSEGNVSPMCDNILLLQLQTGGRSGRSLRVLKTRGGAHSPQEHSLAITDRGPSVEGS